MCNEHVVRGAWWVVPVAVFTTLTDLSRGQLRSLCRGAGPATTVVIHGQASQQAATAPAGRTKKPKCKPRITSHTVRLPVLGFTPCCALRLPVVTADMTATRQPHLGHLFQWRPWRTIKHQHLASPDRKWWSALTPWGEYNFLSVASQKNVANFSPPRIETCKACQRIVLRKIVYMFSEIQLGQVYKLLNSKNAGKYFSPRLNKLLIV